MKIPASARRALPTAGLLLALAAAVGLRVAIGGPRVAQSATAGLAFAACLAGLAWATRTRLGLSWRALGTGALGGLALCIPAIIVRFASGAHVPAGNYPAWAGVIAGVAVAEEYYLRGALFDATDRWLGQVPAVLVAAAAFAALHVPLYGWHVLPLDFAVGLWLGSLRVVARTPAAPAVAHTLADLLAWWLR